MSLFFNLSLSAAMPASLFVNRCLSLSTLALCLYDCLSLSTSCSLPLCLSLSLSTSVSLCQPLALCRYACLSLSTAVSPQVQFQGPGRVYVYGIAAHPAASANNKLVNSGVLVRYLATLYATLQPCPLTQATRGPWYATLQPCTLPCNVVPYLSTLYATLQPCPLPCNLDGCRWSRSTTPYFDPHPPHVSACISWFRRTRAPLLRVPCAAA